LITKPDCLSRFSTLQSAHFPVRGHETEVVLLLVLAIATAEFEAALVFGSD